MEILKTETFESEFYFGIVFLSLVVITCFIVTILLIKSFKKSKEKLMSAFFIGLFLSMAMCTAYWMPQFIINGVKVRYLAKVTDTTEVYKQGYEIVDEEYGVYTLRKVDKDERVHVQNP